MGDKEVLVVSFRVGACGDPGRSGGDGRGKDSEQKPESAPTAASPHRFFDGDEPTKSTDRSRTSRSRSMANGMRIA